MAVDCSRIFKANWNAELVCKTSLVIRGEIYVGNGLNPIRKSSCGQQTADASDAYSGKSGGPMRYAVLLFGLIQREEQAACVKFFIHPVSMVSVFFRSDDFGQQAGNALFKKVHAKVPDEKKFGIIFLSMIMYGGGNHHHGLHAWAGQQSVM